MKANARQSAGERGRVNPGPDQIRKFLRERPRMAIRRDDLTRAAVLMLLFPRNGELNVLLTKRSADVEHHKGQISFPGGAVDVSDDSIVATALREAEEEVGLSVDGIDILGLFDDFWTPSGFCVTPVIGYTPALGALKPSPVEVEEILEVPLSFFQNRKNETTKKFRRDGKWIDVYFYRHGSTEIWGATAAIVRSFLRAWEGFEAEQ